MNFTPTPPAHPCCTEWASSYVRGNRIVSLALGCWLLSGIAYPVQVLCHSMYTAHDSINSLLYTLTIKRTKVWWLEAGPWNSYWWDILIWTTWDLHQWTVGYHLWWPFWPNRCQCGLQTVGLLQGHLLQNKCQWRVQEERISVFNIIIIFHMRRFNSGSGPIWLDDLQCRVSDTRLISCPHRGIGSHSCGHSEDIAVYCNSKWQSAYFITKLQ